jgi:hypothetical protein
VIETLKVRPDHVAPEALELPYLLEDSPALESHSLKEKTFQRAERVPAE